jgi:hypothetical protein
MRKKRLFKMKIVPAATDHVADYADEIGQSLLYIGELVDPGDAEDWASSCFVSDLSRLADFMSTKDYHESLEAKLGFSVDRKDRVVAIAARMRLPTTIQ